MIIPRLRTNFTLFETYQECSSFPLDIPLIACRGMDDRIIPAKNLQEWNCYTTKHFAIHLFLRGHFYHFITVKELSKYLTLFIK